MANNRHEYNVQAAAAGSCGAGVEHLSINRLQQRIPPCLPFHSSCLIVDRLLTYLFIEYATNAAQ